MVTSVAHIQASLEEAQSALHALLHNQEALAAIAQAAALLIGTFAQKGRVYTCGNGGSMCDAMHFAEELTGRYRQDRPALRALCHVNVCTPGGQYADRVQELHIKVLHILIELIERHFFPQNYLN